MPESPTHERAVLRQDNGELQEDVVAKEAPDDGTPGSSSVDEEGEESFPASDPPSEWAGAAAGEAPDPERVVERRPVEHVPERAEPSDPVPKTLPNDR